MDLLDRVDRLVPQGLLDNPEMLGRLGHLEIQDHQDLWDLKGQMDKLEIAAFKDSLAHPVQLGLVVFRAPWVFLGRLEILVSLVQSGALEVPDLRVREVILGLLVKVGQMVSQEIKDLREALDLRVHREQQGSRVFLEILDSLGSLVFLVFLDNLAPLVIQVLQVVQVLQDLQEKLEILDLLVEAPTILECRVQLV